MLTEIEKDNNNPRNSFFMCSCGVVKSIRRSAVKSGSTKSCGCHRSKIAVDNGKKVSTHNMSNTPVYRYWSDNRNKLTNWKTFEDFYKEVGCKYTPNHCLNENNEWVSSKVSKKINYEKTCIEKYGEKSALLNQDIKAKIKKTNIEKYGTENVLSNTLVRDKIKKTCLEKYGVENYSASDEFKDKITHKYSLYDGKTSKERCLELGITQSYFTNLVKKFGLDYALNFSKKRTYIEQFIYEYLLSLQIDFKEQYKIGKYYADFQIGKIIIEVDGLYWHSDSINTNKKYHKEKREFYIENGYQPLFFRENEIIESPDVVKSIINNRLGLNLNKVFARDTKVSVANNDFFKLNHLMGAGSGKIISLDFNKETVAALRYIEKKDYIDISRFCTLQNYSVVGGFSKLISKLPKGKPIVNFVDLRYGSGNYLTQLGFRIESENLSFAWVKNDKSFHRMIYRSNTGYDLGFNKLWDCGQRKYIKDK